MTDRRGGVLFRMHPQSGAQTVVSSGGDLRAPVGLALDGNDSLLVADLQATGHGGVLRIDPTTGSQALVSPLVIQGMSIDGATGLIRWTPSIQQTGSHDITVEVSDGRGGTGTQHFTITVNGQNSAPTITSSPNMTATVSQLYSYDVEATDLDTGDVLTFALVNAPTGMTINTTTGLIQWTPTVAQVGNQSGTVRVQDAGGLFVTQDFMITVTAVNHPPTVTSTPVVTATVGQPYSYDVDATDPDPGDVLTFALTTAPAGMAIQPSTGVITWTPTVEQVGSQAVVVRVTDTGGLSAEQSFTVTVKTSNQAPLAQAGLLGAPNLPACVAPPGGLVAWYPGDGHASDIIGSSSPTNIIGSPQFVPGKVGQSMRFDGSSGFIVPNNATIDFGATDSFTLDTWVRVDGRTGAGDNTIVDKRGPSDQRGYLMDALLEPFAPSGMVQFIFSIIESHSRDVFGQPATRPVPLGEYYFVTGVVDRTKQTIAIYLNGVLEQELSIAHVGDIAGAGRLFIGHHSTDTRPDTNVRPLVGSIDELEIIHRALSQAEIQSLFLAGSAGKCKIRVGETVMLDSTHSTDPDGDPLAYRWILLATPAGSTAALSDPNAVQPTFVVDQPGTYRVQLIVSDGTTDSAPADITLVVLDANRPSIALDDSYTVTLGDALTVAAPGVIANDHDADGATLSATVLSGPSHGTLSFTPDGSFAYTAKLDVHGPGPTAHTVIATVHTAGVPRAMAVNHATNRVYVPSIFGNRVTVIDGTTNKTIAVVPIPHSYLEEVALNPLTNRIYASGTRLSNYVPGGGAPNANELTVINGATDTILATIPVDDQPQALVVNPSTNRIYVAHVPLNTVSVVDGVSNTVITSVPVGTHPQQIGIDPTLNRIYVLSTDDDTVTVLDGATNTVLTTIPVGDEPRFLEVVPSTHHVYVANFTSDTVSVINGETNTVVTTIPVGDGPIALAVNPISNSLYVGNFNSNTVSVVDTTSHAVRQTIPVGTGPRSIAVNVLTNRVYVSNLTSNTVSVIDGVTEVVTATVPVGAEPQVVGVNPVTDRVYVGEAGTHAVSILHVGDHFVYKASDGALDSNLATVTFIIEPSDLAPAALPDAYRVEAGTTLTVAAPGVLENDLDAGGSALTALRVSGPMHGTITLQTNGAFTYTPAPGFSGTDTFTYTAHNGSLTSNVATVTITVVQVNHPPVITSLPVTAATESQPYRYDVEASDPDTGDTVTFALAVAPVGMTIDAVTGLIQWTPTVPQLGDHTVTVRVHDAGGLFAAQSFTLTVASGNQPPVITSTPSTAAVVGQLYTYDVEATDSNAGDALTFSLITAPAGMTIHATTGMMQWTPTTGQVGANTVTVKVQDQGTLSATQEFTITVAAVGTIAVPDVIGQTPTEAETAITAANLTVGTITTVDNTIALSVTALPSTQGWVYGAFGNTAPEPQVFSIGNGVLQQNTLGVGLTTDPNELHANLYQLPEVVDPRLPFTLTVTARVLQDEGETFDPFSFSVGVVTGPEQFAIGINTQRVRDSFGEEFPITIDTTQFHEYRLEGTPEVGFTLFIDSIFVGTGQPLPAGGAGPGFVVLGDVSGLSNARADVQALTFQQGAGLVIAQAPQAGTLTVAGAAVHLTVAQPPASVLVPDVVGLPQADAITTLVGAGLSVGVIQQAFSLTVPADHVISQTPGADVTVPERTAVALVVSLGPAQVMVPNVVGETEADARADILAAQLTVGPVTSEYSPTVPAGRIIRQNPTAGSTVNEGTAVSLVVSLGPPPLVAVPDVVGQPQATAEDTIVMAGLAVGVVSTARHPTVPAGQVISQQPAAGMFAPLGSAVDLLVSLGPPGPQDLASVLVQPGTPLILATQTQPIAVLGVLGNGSSRNLAGQVTWSSSNPTIATVDSNGVVTGVAAGTVTISATKDGITGTVLLTIVQPAPGDTTFPTAEMTAPVHHAVVTSPTAIVGTATDANFFKYVLEYAPAGTTTFTVLTTGTAPVTNGVLGTLDPTLLLNDLYTLRLTVFDRANNMAEDRIQVQVAREQKVGIFTVAFQDLSLPVACLPITVTRVYDSRDTALGDFGIGWRLDLQTMRLRESREQGSAWFVDLVDVPGSFGVPIPTFFLVENDVHKISLTLPDGHVEEFDLTPTPNQNVGAPIQEVTVSYTPRPGTLGTLTSLPATERTLLLTDTTGEVELITADTDVFNPRTFEYTTPDGTVFTIDKFNGVQQVRCANGPTLTVGPGGISHSLGTGVTFARDAQGRITTITDPNGHTRQYAYDANGDLVSTTDPAGQTTSFLYNFRHGLLEINDPRGVRAIRNEYDANGRLISHTDAAGQAITYTRDLVARTETVTNRLGQATTYEYDDTGNVLRQIDAAGGSTTFTYDAFGNELTRTDPLGRTTERTYDSRRNVLKEVDPLGNETRYTYTARNAVRTITDALGRVTTNTYDAQGNLTETLDPLGNRTTNTYDTGGVITQGTGNLLSTTNALSQTTSYTYDSLGRLTQETNPLGHVTTYTYDANGNRTTQTTTRTTASGPETLITTYAYDGFNRLVQTTSPDGSTTQTLYNAIGKQSATIDQLGRQTSYAYDDQGRLTRTTSPDGTSESSTYDAEGRRLTSTDRAGRVTTSQYDALGRLVQTTSPDGATQTTTYDAAGQVLATTDARGNTTTYAYDAAGRRTTVTDALGHTTVFTYDPVGNQQTMTDANNHTITFEYDSINRRTRVLYPDTTVDQTMYDALGRTTSRTDQAGKTTQFTYDVLGRLIKVTDALNQETTYSYDNVGNLQSYLYPNGVKSEYSYNTLNRLTNLTISNVSTLANYTYTLGLAGNRTSVTEHSGRKASYTYDDLYRLTEEKIENDPAGINGTISYEYDPVGNRNKRMSTVAGIPSMMHAYDANDRLTSDAYDDNGNTTGSDGRTYAYDFENHLTEQNGGAVTIVYDGDGNRVVKTVGGVTTRYLVDDRNLTGHAQVLEEIIEDNVQRVYTYGLDLISQSQFIGSIWSVSFYGYDGHGSVRSLTSTNGVVTDTYDYDAFGNLIASTGSTPNNYLYTGEQLDPNVGFYYLRARYANPGAGRFASSDSHVGVLTEPMSLHKYVYAANNPINLLDPSGHQFVGIIDALVSNVTLGILVELYLPTFVRAASITAGILIFYRPGFRLRNMGLNFLATGKLGPQGLHAAHEMIVSGNEMIEVGSEWILQTDEFIQDVFRVLSLRSLSTAVLRGRAIQNSIAVSSTLRRLFSRIADPARRALVRQAFLNRNQQLLRELLEHTQSTLLEIEGALIDFFHTVITAATN